MPTIERISLSSVSSIEDDPKLHEFRLKLERMSAMHTRLCIVGVFMGILTLILAIALVVCVIKINSAQGHSSKIQNIINQIKLDQQNTNNVLEQLRSENKAHQAMISMLKNKQNLYSAKLRKFRNETKLKTIDVLEKSLAAVNKSIAEDKEREEEIKSKWDNIKRECDSNSGLFDNLEDRIYKLQNVSKHLENSYKIVIAMQEDVMANLTQLRTLTDSTHALYLETKTESTDLDKKFENLKQKQIILDDKYSNITISKEIGNVDVDQLKEHIVTLRGLFSELNETSLSDYSEEIFHNEQDISGLTAIIKGQHHEILANKQGIAVFRSRIEVVERELKKKIEEVHLRLKNLIDTDRKTTNTTLSSFQNTLKNISGGLSASETDYNILNFNMSEIISVMDSSLVDFSEVQKNTADVQDLTVRIDLLDQNLNQTNDVAIWGFVEPRECETYTNISDSWRLIKYGRQEEKNCDKDTHFNQTWTRFVHPSGTILPTHVPLKGASNRKSRDVCGTSGSGWMRGSHPSGGEGVVHRTVCFEWSTDCDWSVDIEVVKCHQFYLYKLQNPPECDLAYCTV